MQYEKIKDVLTVFSTDINDYIYIFFFRSDRQEFCVFKYILDYR